MKHDFIIQNDSNLDVQVYLIQTYKDGDAVAAPFDLYNNIKSVVSDILDVITLTEFFYPQAALLNKFAKQIATTSAGVSALNLIENYLGFLSVLPKYAYSKAVQSKIDSAIESLDIYCAEIGFKQSISSSMFQGLNKAAYEGFDTDSDSVSELRVVVTAKKGVLATYIDLTNENVQFQLDNNEYVRLYINNYGISPYKDLSPDYIIDSNSHIAPALWDKCYVEWGNQERMGSDNDDAVGTNPSVAIIKKGVLVENHRSHDTNGIYYSLGNFQVIDGCPTLAWNSSSRYDLGDDMSIATGRYFADDDRDLAVFYVMNVHTSYRDGNHGLFYSFGIYTGVELSWEIKGSQYTTGSQPDIAVHGKRFLEIHKGSSDDTLYYRVATLTKLPDFSWEIPNLSGISSISFASGTNPSVDIMGSLAVVVYCGDKKNQLCYRIGIINSSSTEVNWGGEWKLDSEGTNPSVKFAGDGKRIILCFSSGDSIITQVGYIDTNDSVIFNYINQEISWFELFVPTSFYGKKPRLNAYGDEVVLTYTGKNETNNLYCVGGLLK